jgi:putative transposase
MPREPRRHSWTEAACFHILNRGHNRDTIFAEEADLGYFMQLLHRYRDRFHLRIYHYCLMSNHFHLLPQLPDARRLSSFMAGILRSYVHFYHGHYGYVGHLFQGRFKSPVIEAERYLLTCGRYIERNPLKAGMVAEPWLYRWSSCRAYVLGEVDTLLSVKRWYEELSPKAEKRRRLWRAFVLGEDPNEEVVSQKDWAIGSARFRAGWEQEHSRPVARGRDQPRKVGKE